MRKRFDVLKAAALATAMAWPAAARAQSSDNDSSPKAPEAAQVDDQYTPEGQRLIAILEDYYNYKYDLVASGVSAVRIGKDGAYTIVDMLYFIDAPPHTHADSVMVGFIVTRVCNKEPGSCRDTLEDKGDYIFDTGCGYGKSILRRRHQGHSGQTPPKTPVHYDDGARWTPWGG